MSSRVLKKLGLQKDAGILKADNDSDADADISGASCGKEKHNKYDLVRLGY